MNFLFSATKTPTPRSGRIASVLWCSAPVESTPGSDTSWAMSSIYCHKLRRRIKLRGRLLRMWLTSYASRDLATTVCSLSRERRVTIICGWWSHQRVHQLNSQCRTSTHLMSSSSLETALSTADHLSHLISLLILHLSFNWLRKCWLRRSPLPRTTLSQSPSSTTWSPSPTTMTASGLETTRLWTNMRRSSLSKMILRSSCLLKLDLDSVCSQLKPLTGPWAARLCGKTPSTSHPPNSDPASSSSSSSAEIRKRPGRSSRMWPLRVV